ncbi:EAL domain-containing protein [Trinickia caryophylli]|uniref:Diguanylate phosphodiesterase n=1 Tax=Trinickia caryophylli TaxID=28094 RepID=A0A1X7FTE3_TRICW|nr:EAL domain-containing protein [Trinickia caryophylli]PMS11928.1 PTS lactose transporter subunit IIC [Trinickia caryophylli]TRX13995.1 EAL domain-containing protein [Trinickia caryophylli]WQE15591.1 EAL domain-containing protein [Trinickia caryophylli]SMF58407.1 diguanylate phosphodiesterase [Trinickia caryophylli]GLU33650.1 PTS lactose transporter subunit IIC [Trinickia caryophylli]
MQRRSYSSRTTAVAPARLHRLWAWVERIDRTAYFIAIRRGLALPLPLIMTGAFALLVRYPPSPALQQRLIDAFGPHLLAFCDNLLAGTFGIGALVALYGFTDALTSLHNERNSRHAVNRAIAVIVVTACFFTCIAPDGKTTAIASLYLGEGLFGALVVASLGGYLFIKLSEMRFLRIPMNNLSNDPFIGDTFTVMPAAILTIVIFATLKTIWSWYGWPDALSFSHAQLDAPLASLANNPFFGAGYESVAQLLWLFGIHGPNALYEIQRQVLAPAGAANLAAAATSATPPFVFTYEFFAAFARMGGSGGTLSLVFALVLAGRAERGRRLALFAMLPALFNVNELVLFGLPIVLNPVYAIPFILTPVVQILIAYAATAAHLMPKTGFAIAWTTPALYSGYAVTGSLSGTLVQALALAAGTVIYIPFVRMAEHLALKREREALVSLLDIAEAPPRSPHAARYIGLAGDPGRLAASLAGDFQIALKTEGQIFLEFQPQVDSRTGRIFGVEALLRWEHPSLGRVAPPIVITLADELDQTDVLGLQILSLACRQRSIWRNALPDDFVMSVNLSPRQLLDPHFDIKVMDILRREAVLPSMLELEITESTILLPDVNALGNLKRLRETGVKVAVDDFGMGHTSLHYLRLLPLDTVKIDRSLADVSRGSVNEHIVKSIADLSRTLNLSLVVEGVETEWQLARLSALGCHRFQGYFFSRPLAGDACLEFVVSANRERRFAA